MLDVLAAVARKDYDDRRRRQAEGVSRARTAGLYKGRVENTARNAAIARSLKDGQSWREIMIGTGCSRTLLAKIARRRRTNGRATPAALIRALSRTSPERQQFGLPLPFQLAKPLCRSVDAVVRRVFPRL
jgi:DNA invertase Pin-like site-specific DNA recombinase